MNKKNIQLALISLALVGCASVPMENTQKTSTAKQYLPPSEGKAGLYLYRYGSFGAALKKDIWIDGNCVGETARNTFFYEEVSGGAEHKISTESEFSPNDLLLTPESGKLYFIKQYIKFGLFVGGAGLKLADEVEAKKEIGELSLATRGTCSEKTTTTK